MRSKVKFLIAIACFVGLAAAWAQEEGGEGESTKTFDLGYSSVSDSRNTDASVSYTVPLTENVDFSTSTSLGNGYNLEDNRYSRGRNTSLSVDYDPPSPWRLNVAYGNTYNLVHRPLSEEYAEFKTESSSNNVNSSLNYEFSDDLKADLTLGVDESSQRVIIQEGTVPPPSSGRGHTYGGGVDYNLTAATSLGLNYSGSIESSKIELARTRTFPPRPPKPALSRRKGNGLSAQLNTNKDLSEKVNLNLSLGASENVGRDNLQPALDSDSLNGNAQGDVTYNVSSLLALTNSVNVGRSLDLYLNKPMYEKQFNEPVYDAERSSFTDNAGVRLTPGEHSEMNVGIEYAESESVLYDEDGKLPDAELYPEKARLCTTSQSYKATSDFDLALGENITFHLAHYLTESHPHKLLFEKQDQTTRINNLDGSIGFDWTEDLRVDVNTAMNVNLYRYDDPETAQSEDLDDLNVYLATGFIYDVTRDTTLEIHTDIRKTSRNYVHPESTLFDTAKIDRHLSTKARHEFGEIFKPDVTIDLTYGREYFPRSPESNRRRWVVNVSPGTEINTSDNLKINLRFSFENEETDKVYDPKPEDWELRRSYGAGAGITYIIFKDLSLAFNTNNSHAVTIRNRVRRHKEVPAESFFDFDASLSYTF